MLTQLFKSTRAGNLLAATSILRRLAMSDPRCSGRQAEAPGMQKTVSRNMVSNRNPLCNMFQQDEQRQYQKQSKQQGLIHMLISLPEPALRIIEHVEPAL